VHVLLLALVALFATAPSAHAVPVAAVAAVLGVSATGWIAAAATAVLNFTLGSIASLLVTKLFTPKLRDEVAQQQADVTSVQFGEGPATAVLGRAMVGGRLVDAFNWGPQNEWETLVIRLADHEVDALESVIVNDKVVPFVEGFIPGFESPASTPGYGAASCLEINFRNGAYPAPEPPAVCVDHNGWSVEHDRMHGRTYVAVSYRYNADVWPQGRPRFGFVLRGAKLYDPRLDSTVPGGAGPQRYADRSTWTWSENGALVIANYAWGIHTRGYDGQLHLMVGPGATLADRPPEDTIAHANLCDERVALKAGGDEPRWRLSAVVNADEVWRTVLENLAASIAGDVVDREGSLTVEPGSARVPAPAFDDDALLVGERVRFQDFEPRDRVVNAVLAKYVDPAQLWNQASAPLRRSLDDIAADGRVNETTLDLKHCLSGTQAQRVAEIARRRARLERSATVVLGPRFGGLEAGDWLPWQSQREFAGGAVTFQVTAVDAGPAGRTALALRETGASCFAWNPALDELDPNVPAYLPSAGRAPLTVQGLAASPGVETPSAGVTAAVLALTWTPVTDPACTGLRAEFRRLGTTAVEVRLFTDAALGAETLRGAIEHDRTYEVRLTPVVSGTRRVQPTSWVQVTTPPLPLADVEGLTAVARADGVTLSWTPSSQPEVSGYDVRRGTAFDTPWDEAAVLQQGFGGSTLFAELTSAGVFHFFVRARDRQGRLSAEATAARVSGQVTAPGVVQVFEAAPNADVVRFEWSEVAGASSYEIRAGLTWETGRVVDRPTGFSTTVQWPILNEVDAFFWIKALSAARLYSPTARLFVARTAPVTTRNVVYTRDIVEENWPGVRHDFTLGGDGSLELDALGGVALPFGDYYDEIPLDRSFYARAWTNARAAAFVGESPTWNDLDDVAWDDTGDSVWGPILGDAGTARLDVYIAPALQALPGTLVEGWRLAEDALGVKDATAPELVVNLTHAACLAAAGAALASGRVLGWALAVPTSFSLFLDLAPEGAQTGAAPVLTLARNDGGWLQVWRGPAGVGGAAELRVTLDTGQSASVSAPVVDGDVLRLCLFQDAASGTVRLYVASRRANPGGDLVGAATLSGVTARSYDRLYLGSPAAGAALDWTEADFAWDDEQGELPWAALTESVGTAATATFSGVFGDVELHTGATLGAAFPSNWLKRGPVGFDNWRTFTPGDYRIQHAGLWFRLSAPDPVGQTLTVPEASVFVDVPDVIDRLFATIGAAPTTIAFTRPFYEPPEVAAEFRGGLVKAQARVLDVTTAHVELVLVDVADFETPVAGDVSVIAAGF
jgi:hypothetical protein